MLSVTLTLLEGLVVTLELFGLTLLFALPLGLVISFGSMSRCTPLRRVVKTIVWVVRGTPLMLQIMVVFYGPGLMFGLPLLPRFTAAVVTFVINYACYFSEIYRGGIQGVPVGQREAGLVLGIIGTAFGVIGVLCIICAAGALVSMVGDLAASAIKRQKNIKDYGKLIPGHGGILDRFDSVIFTAPMIYILAAVLT